MRLRGALAGERARRKRSAWRARVGRGIRSRNVALLPRPRVVCERPVALIVERRLDLEKIALLRTKQESPQVGLAKCSWACEPPHSSAGFARSDRSCRAARDGADATADGLSVTASASGGSRRAQGMDAFPGQYVCERRAATVPNSCRQTQRPSARTCLECKLIRIFGLVVVQHLQPLLTLGRWLRRRWQRLVLFRWRRLIQVVRRFLRANSCGYSTDAGCLTRKGCSHTQ
jgi:hypothetical protein